MKETIQGMQRVNLPPLLKNLLPKSACLYFTRPRAAVGPTDPLLPTGAAPSHLQLWVNCLRPHPELQWMVET